MWKVVLAGLLIARTAHADAGDRWDGVMIAEQGGGGLLGGALGMAAGASFGLAVAGKSDKFLNGLGEAVLFGGIGAAAGITVGVQLAGDARGGNGHWAATAGGAVIGGALTLLTAPRAGDKLPWQLGLGIAFVTLLGPPIIAYHLSSDANASDHEARVMVPLLLGGF
jgi:hypothetical protein